MSDSAGGKPWSHDSTHATYEDANNRREDLLEKWRSAKKLGMQVKVSYRDNRSVFVVKTRLHPDFEPPKAQKKSRKKSKKKANE